MNLIRKTLLSLAFASASVTASAAILHDGVGSLLSPLLLDAAGENGLQSFTYIHTITDDGFSTPSDSINFANLGIWLGDWASKEKWKLDIGLDQDANGGPLANKSFTHLNFTLNAQSIIDLLDGEITTTITATKGKFAFLQSDLWVDYTPDGRVPEPATIAMFGIGLLAFAAARRRSLKSNNG